MGGPWEDFAPAAVEEKPPWKDFAPAAAAKPKVTVVQKPVEPGVLDNVVNTAKEYAPAVVEGVKAIPGAALDMAKHVGQAALTQPEEGLFDISGAPRRMGDFLKGLASGVTAGIYKPEAPKTEAEAARQTAGNLAGFVAPFRAVSSAAKTLGAGKLASEVIAGGLTGAAAPAVEGDVKGAITAGTTGAGIGAGFYAAGAAFKKLFGRAPKSQAEVEQVAKEQPAFAEEVQRVSPEEVAAFKREVDSITDRIAANQQATQQGNALDRLNQNLEQLNNKFDEMSRRNRPDYGEQVAAQSAEAVTPGAPGPERPRNMAELLKQERLKRRGAALDEQLTQAERLRQSPLGRDALKEDLAAEEAAGREKELFSSIDEHAKEQAAETAADTAQQAEFAGAKRLHPAVTANILAGLEKETTPQGPFAVALDKSMPRDLRRIAAQRLNDMNIKEVFDAVKEMGADDLNTIARSKMFDPRLTEFAKARVKSAPETKTAGARIDEAAPVDGDVAIVKEASPTVNPERTAGVPEVEKVSQPASVEKPTPPANPAPVGKTWSEAVSDLSEHRDIKPRPLNKLYGPNPTPEQIADHSAKMKVWNAEERRLRKVFNEAKAAQEAMPIEEQRALEVIRRDEPAEVNAKPRTMGDILKDESGVIQLGKNKPREFFRATEPGRTERIKTGDNFWDSLLFASDNKQGASSYGSQITKIGAKPDAKILYEGTAEFNRLGGRAKKGKNLLQWASDIAQRAKDAGYDAVWFRRQGDVGTAIINRDKFETKPRSMRDVLGNQRGEVVLREEKPVDETVGKGRLAFGQFLEQSGKTLEKTMGGEGKELSTRLKAARNNAELDAGNAIENVTSLTKKLSPAEQNNFVDVLEGKAQPSSNAVQMAAGVARRELAKVAEQSSEAGLFIRNPATGEKIPFAPRQNYFPHIGGQELGTAVKDPQLRVKIKAALKEQMGPNVNDAQVEKTLQELLKRSRGRYGHLEIARLFDLGDYERNPNIALTKYFADAYRRIHLAKQLGPEFETAEGLLTKIGQSKGQGAEDFGRTLYQREAGIESHDPTTRNIIRAATNFQVATKLGQAVIGNATQPAYTAIYTGLKNTAKAYAKTLTPEGREFGRRILGASIDDFIKESTEGTRGPGARAAEYVLKRSGFNAVERMNRIVSANAGRFFVRDLFEKLQKNPNSTRLRTALEKLNVNPDDALQRGKLTAAEEQRAGQAAINRTQFRTDPQEIPLFWSSDAGRLLTQFKKFSFKSGQFLKDEILKEAVRGNLKPILRAAVVLPVAGGAATKVKDFVRFGDQGADNETIADFVAATGIFGLFADFVANKGRSSASGIKFVAGPTVGDVGDFFDVAKQTRNRLVEGEDNAGKPLGKFIARNVPIVGPSIRNIFNDEKTDEQKARAEKRKTMREMGFEKPSKKKLRKELGLD